MLLSTLLSNPNYPKKSIIEKLVMHRVNISKEELFTKNTLEVSEEDVLWIQD
jgi:hypothetical protein